MKRKNYVGFKFGHLIVKEMLYGYKGSRRTYCKCICDCGNEYITTIDSLKRGGNTISCGCLTSEYRTAHNFTDETGMKFGKLTILKIIRKEKSFAICKCDCGNIVSVLKSDVISGHTRSCGCLHKERVSETNTIDFTGCKSDCGVELISKSHQNKNGVWLWNCRCPLCGNSFVALPAKIMSNHTTSCGCKVQSSNERIIESHLISIGAEYEKEKRFSDCKCKYTLPFDFAVYDAYGKMSLIEYDGKQHFQSVSFWGGKTELSNIQYRDAIKTSYCEENKIPLYRFSDKNSIDEIKAKITNIIYP